MQIVGVKPHTFHYKSNFQLWSDVLFFSCIFCIRDTHKCPAFGNAVAISRFRDTHSLSIPTVLRFEMLCKSNSEILWLPSPMFKLCQVLSCKRSQLLIWKWHNYQVQNGYLDYYPTRALWFWLWSMYCVEKAGQIMSLWAVQVPVYKYRALKSTLSKSGTFTRTKMPWPSLNQLLAGNKFPLRFKKHLSWESKYRWSIEVVYKRLTVCHPE
jgi:hypothetical protein